MVESKSIEVTPEMIKVGVGLMLVKYDPEQTDLECFVELLFREMYLASPESLHQNP